MTASSTRSPLTAHRSRHLDQGRPPRSPPQRPHPAGSAGPFGSGRLGRDPREGRLLRRAGPLDRHLARAGAHVLQGNGAAGRRRHRARDQVGRWLPQRRHRIRSHDATSRCFPSSGLAAALDIQSDALRNSVIDPGELARELQVIIQEAKRKRDTPGAVAHETLHELMFDRHRIRRWRIGTEEQLARLTRDDLWSLLPLPLRTRANHRRDYRVVRARARARAGPGGLRRLAVASRSGGPVPRGAAAA